MTITIRAAVTMADCSQISQLEAEIWGGETTTASLLRSIMHGRGTMLMALKGEKVVGFCYSFLSFTEQGGQKELKHYSYILGVHPDYRDQNLGYQLKMAQREVVLEQGIGHMTWAYDPLETRNANLNLSKLRGVCNTYYESFYGLTDDPLNKGMATDRFMVDWWVDSEWVGQPAELPQTRVEWLAQEAVIINPTIKQAGQFPQPNDAAAPIAGRYCLLEVPDDIQAIKAADLPLAQRWRRHTRRLFKEAFAAGYTAVSLVREAGRCYYVLEKDWQRK